jgi:Na+/melibiose symporter-like transporter
MGLSSRKKVLYALGQFGLVLCAYGVGKFFSAFFVNRSFSDAPVFPEYVYQGYLFGFFTIMGLIIALTRLVDAVAGVFAGHASDRSRMKRGRRTGFMLGSAAPLALFSVLVFMPPVEGSSILNAAVVLVTTSLFYVLLALYTTPYLALMSECGNSTNDRIKISTLMAVATACAALLGDRIVYFVDRVGALTGSSPVVAFRFVLFAYALVSFLCMLSPALFIDERRYAKSEPVTGTLSASFTAVFKDTCFRPYLVADIMYRIASSFAMAGFSYYVTVLLGLPVSFIVFFLLFIFFANIAFYVPISILVQKLGKRRMLFAAFLMLMIFLSASIFAGTYPIPSVIQGTILSILVAIPIAIFTVVPNAVVADLAVAAEKKTGVQRAGMYFGVYSLVMKLGQMFSLLLFPLVMSIGARRHNGAGTAGLRTTLLLAAVFSLVGFFALFGYREKEVSSLLEKKD